MEHFSALILFLLNFILRSSTEIHSFQFVVRGWATRCIEAFARGNDHFETFSRENRDFFLYAHLKAVINSIGRAIYCINYIVNEAVSPPRQTITGKKSSLSVGGGQGLITARVSLPNSQTLTRISLNRTKSLLCFCKLRRKTYPQLSLRIDFTLQTIHKNTLHKILFT